MADGDTGKQLEGEWVLRMPTISRLFIRPPVIREMTTAVEVECILHYLEQFPTKLSQVIDTQRAYFALMSVASWQNRVNRARMVFPADKGETQRYETITSTITDVRNEISVYSPKALTTPAQDENVRKWRNLTATRAINEIVKKINAQINEKVLAKFLSKHDFLLLPFLLDEDFLETFEAVDPDVAKVLLGNPIVREQIEAFKLVEADDHRERVITRAQILLPDLQEDCRLLLKDIVEFEGSK